MGYTLRIGNAVPEFSKEDGELSARWVVENAELPEAPAFPNDINNHRNCRWPSYLGWADFCRNAGIYELFYGTDRNARGGLLEHHPGCVMLTADHHAIVAKALKNRQEVATLPPGFMANPHFGKPEDQVPGKFDPTLARLIWLEWWMRWALHNAETPAIYNS